MSFTNVVITTAIVTCLSVTAAASKDAYDVTITDYNKSVIETIPVVENICSWVEVPIYETVQRKGNAAEGALAGMIIGGLIGGTASGKDEGAAAGAIIGGLIGADKGSKPKTEQVITGYKREKQCSEFTDYRNVTKQVYDYSIIKFKYKGYWYEVPFEK